MSKSEGHGDGCVCYSCIDDAEDTITIPRNLHELYKEAAEKWAERCEVAFYVEGHFAGGQYVAPSQQKQCAECRAYNGCTATCNAARILVLRARRGVRQV